MHLQQTPQLRSNRRLELKRSFVSSLSPSDFRYLCLCAGEAHRIVRRSQRPPDERADPAQGALQHSDTQRHLPHQPHQAADHGERGVSEQQQLLERDCASRACGCTVTKRGGVYVHAWMHAGLMDCECVFLKRRTVLVDDGGFFFGDTVWR